MATVAVDRLTIDPRLQHRDDARDQPNCALPARVAEYAELMRGGIAFPPIRVIRVGPTRYVYGGFHTLAAHRACGRERVPVEERTGTWEEAVLLSAAENIGPANRTADTIRTAVFAALSTAAGRALSDQALGQHCGVSRSRVQQLRAEWTELQAANQAAAGGEDAGGTAEAPPEGGRRRVRTRHGTYTDMDTSNIGRRRRAEPEVPRDDAGTTVPERLRDLFAERLPRDWSVEVGTIEAEAAGVTNDYGAWMQLDELREHAARMKELIAAGLPYGVCPACRGESCVRCRHAGWLPRWAYEQLLGELEVENATHPAEAADA